MVRKSLLFALLLAIASPLVAQEEGYTWTSQRPDGIPPGGVTNGQVLKQGRIMLSYRFENLHSRGLWLQTDSLDVATAMQSYTQVPLSSAYRTHYATVAFGVTDDLTLMFEGSYSQRERQQIAQTNVGNVVYTVRAHQLGDSRATALYQFFNKGAWRANLEAGALIPTGEINVFAETPLSNGAVVAMPYDMQIGAGTFAVLPGLTVQTQNEHASVGAQVRGTFYFGTNSNHYRLGNRYFMTGWAALPISSYFSVSARVAWQKWDRIDGANPSLAAGFDPENDVYYLSGQRVDIPVGINFIMPEASRFAGQRLSLEAVFPVYHKFDGAQLGMDWGLNLGWRLEM